MDTNIFSILYLSYRLSPFILVCFFALSSIINQDFKGLVYLCGLLLITSFSIVIGNFLKTSSWLKRISYSQDPKNENATQTCSLLNLIKGDSLSFLPLGQIVFSYTFAYLMTIIYKYNLVYQNIPIILLFPLIIIYDIFWNIQNGCVNGPLMIVTLIVGLLGGVFWALIIDNLKISKLQYYSGLSNNAVCSLPSSQTFRCVEKAL